MIKLLLPLPKNLTVAFSGGVDSVAVTDFLLKKHNISCAFFHHNTENSEQAFKFVSKFCSDRNITLHTGVLNKTKPKELSMEEHWRNERYNFLENINCTVVTAHHLDDCVETYVWSSLHGKPKVIPTTRNNIIRPFLTTRKQQFESWCDRRNVPYVEDKSNQDTKYTRNYIRNILMPHVLQVNPGIHTVVKKIIEKNL